MLSFLHSQLDAVVALFSPINDEQGLYRYEPGKWSLKEVLGHMTDTERIMSYRMLRIARGDTTNLPGFDQDLYHHKCFFRRIVDGGFVKRLSSRTSSHIFTAHKQFQKQPGRVKG